METQYIKMANSFVFFSGIFVISGGFFLETKIVFEEVSCWLWFVILSEWLGCRNFYFSALREGFHVRLKLSELSDWIWIMQHVCSQLQNMYVCVRFGTVACRNIWSIISLMLCSNCHWWWHPIWTVNHLLLNLPAKVGSVVSPHCSSSLMSRTLSMDFWAVVRACLAKLDSCDALNQLILLYFHPVCVTVHWMST